MKSFRARVLLWLLLLVVAIQVVTVGALVLQANRRAEQQAGEDLLVGARVLDALLQSRAEQLREAVRVLVSDYGFKEAATLSDAATLVSALDNSAERVDAQLAVLLDTQGRVLAATVPRLAKHTPPALQQLAFDTDEAPVVRYLVLNDTLYMLVSTSVRAPTPVATAVLGFAVDAQLAQKLSTLLKYQIGFVSGKGESPLVIGIPEHARAPLVAELRLQNEWSKPKIIQGDRDAYVTWLTPIAGASPELRAVMQKPLDDALASYKSARLVIFLVAAIALLIAIPFALRLARQISRPLEKLARAARRIESGDYTERVALDAPHEFVAVATTLDSMQRNIAEREQRIRYQATHDEATGLPNRLFATQALRDLIATAEVAHKPVALVVIELKAFDQVQSSFGYALGDALIVELANRLGGFVGPGDLLARCAVAQFLFIAPGISLDAAELKARQFWQSVRSGFVNDGLPISLDAHVGVAIYPEHSQQADELQRRADTALFDAKERGVAIAVYDPERDAQRRRQLKLLGDLRRAINADELSLHYQPKVDMRSHAVLSLEALVRWNHPEHGRIPPDEFVPLAERTGNLALLTGWVIKRALSQMREWQAIGFVPDVSVNLSATDMADADLADSVFAHLSRFGVAPHRLVLEVTESAVMQDTKKAVATMERLQQHGVRFSVDDYGTGFSSLAQLKQLPVDELKIDKSFVLHLKENSDDAVIVRSTIELGHSLGMKVVAEGIETPEAWRMLLAWGCDLAQGYLISPPVPAELVPARVQAINDKLVGAETATQQLQALKSSSAR